ncbi:MAG: arginase [Defluviitaleaceae bacterium]|nr:arginase [Defluviitaleaceae bacterium]
MKNTEKIIEIIGVQMDKGAGRRGVDMGPSAIRYAGLKKMLADLDYTVHDSGDINEELSIQEKSKTDQNSRLKDLDVVNGINSRLYEKVLEALSIGRFPLILGGDHSIAAGSATAIQQYFGKIGIIWVDAHGDFNTAKSSPSGNIHGMPLSAITGHGPEEIVPFKQKDSAFIDPKNAVIIGARALDTEERELIKEAGVAVFTMADIDKCGMYDTIEEAVKIASQGTEGIFLSFDLDAIDPTAAPGVGTPVNGGLTYREAHLLCEYLASTNKLLGIEVVELNPILDNRNQTGKAAVQIISSLLCKTIM